MYPMYPLLNLKFPSFGLRISRVVFRDPPGIVLLRAWGWTNLPPTRRMLWIWGAPTLRSNQISSQSSPVPQKSWKLVLRPPQINHEKWILKSWEIQFLWKLIFAIPPLPNTYFCNPRHPNSNPKIIRKSNLEMDMRDSPFLVQKYLPEQQLSK